MTLKSLRRRYNNFQGAQRFTLPDFIPKPTITRVSNIGVACWLNSRKHYEEGGGVALHRSWTTRSWLASGMIGVKRTSKVEEGRLLNYDKTRAGVSVARPLCFSEDGNEDEAGCISGRRRVGWNSNEE